ncbi:o-succinylbenzoate--CoA ligase [Microbacterium pseudoresistens]|uniref:O-succinylbenzoic acid--CoA ligase n=1 Tax=Microbacterium pseudoresistens TaxID=640634 RepID=A0A7Y9JNA7_9MICO|nr:AMP-binding protein [Microbacterium pseudoresistens]NYD53499.1 O-succinylbenzoic acid--CoA ligase [Microbacterium pseudoresistens]
MRLERIDGHDPREVLAGLRGAVHGAGPALALGEPAHPLPDEVPAGTALVITTSGSTGVPKSVALSRAALTASALATAERIGSGAWLLPLSAGYIAGVQVLVRSIVAGREPGILAGRFTAETFAAAAAGLSSYENGARVPTYTSLVPAQLATVLDAAAHDASVAEALRSFEAILVGGQALPVALRERAAAAGARIVRTYGSSETAGGCVYDGIPLDGVRAREVDGEVQLSGPVLADGYLGDPKQTTRRFVVDEGTRWYRTGDAGEVREGAVRVTGRLDNVIVSGGVNVSLDLVERIVQTIPGMEQAVVVGVPDERWGQVPAVVVETAAGDGPDALARIRDLVAAELGAPARPAGIRVVAPLPRLSSGKPDRRALAAQLAG